MVIGAEGVEAAHPANQRGRGGSIPTSALHGPLFPAKAMRLAMIPPRVAREVCERRHYLHTYPGAAILNFGIFVGASLLGVAVIGLGPANVYRFFADARRDEVACLARFWLDDRLARNAESRALGVLLRLLRRHQQTIKALVAYSDPSVGHDGAIYRAAGFLFLGESDASPYYRMADGRVLHSRTIAHAFGSRSKASLAARGIKFEAIEPRPKLIYVALVDPTWRDRLTRPVLPYQEAKG